MSTRKLVLTGFMGTGKTTLGKALAEVHGVPFVDIDDVVVERADKTIPEIFVDIGEAGFRSWEQAVCHDIAAREGALIVATGGGALLNPANRMAFGDATIICLTAQPVVIYDRIKDDVNRPLLNVEDPQVEIAVLLWKRAPVYESFRWRVDTSGLHINELVSHVSHIWKQDTAIREPEQRVQSPEGSYPLLIGEDLLDNLPDILDVYGLAHRRTIIATDTHVAPLYGEALMARFPKAELVVMPAGEQYKNLDSVVRMLDAVARHKLDRNGLIIALGGGVVGDTMGYVAAAYMRGVRLVQIPTTLLAMVDSSVGGKVGVDTAMGKNLVGAFKQPELVLIDPRVLDTLPPEEKRAGMAEVIKAGFLADPELLEENLTMLETIKRAVQVKIDIVQRDPYERGERAHLNLGHTFAHALEQVSGYSWRHGDAVGVGLVGAALLSQQLHMINAETVNYVREKVREQGLPTCYRHYAPEKIYEAMAMDKKWKDAESHFIALQGIGKPVIVKGVPRETVLVVLERLKET
ncbi:MAG: 3-dehydroquinate synthase [Chloroflexi bacterium]|nr:3-dehydroquinate synthase [Chloroflexota bacterium]